VAKITYVEFDGAAHEIDVASGISVMQGAVANGVRGIIGECGGACSCATCHVYVDPAWLDRVGERSAAEEALLEEVMDGRPNSRLSCQINVTDKLDGLVIRMPAKQI
jgi:2Fe-2S ferredoxin